MASSAQTFSADLTKLLAGYSTKLDAIVRQTVQELAERIITRTPVDTGFARNSWWTAVDNSKTNHPSPPKRGRPGVSGSSSGAPALDPLDMVNAPGHVWQLRNNAFYILKLEYGHSAQAPSGMVRLTVAEAGSIVSSYAKKLGAT